MPKRVQRFRVDDATMATLIGLEGEIIANLSNFALHVHDGITEGGFAQALADSSNMQAATIGQDGKMTAALVQQLTSATTDITNNANAILLNSSDIAINVADIAQLDTNKADKIVPSAVGNVPTLSASGNLQDSGLLVTDVGLEAGTIATFNQTTAPIGWTKLLVDDNKAFRLVTGPISSSGSNGFTTVFGSGKTTENHILTIAEIPSHNHDLGKNFANDTYAGGAALAYARSGSNDFSGFTGGDGGHNHDINNFDLAFIDMILAVKD